MLDESETSLRQQVMINQFVATTGCTPDEAKQLLLSARWEFEGALSLFFQDANVGHPPNYTQRACAPVTGGQYGSMPAPSNTPATPPCFPDALLALQKLQASDWNSASYGSTQQAFSPGGFQAPYQIVGQRTPLQQLSPQATPKFVPYQPEKPVFNVDVSTTEHGMYQPNYCDEKMN